MQHARLAATLATALLLVGCSDDPEPRVEPSESASSSPSDSPSSVPPTARDQERDLITNYVREISDSLSSGDPSNFLALSDPDCSNCHALAQGLSEAYRDGGRIVGGSWTIEKATFIERSELGSIWNVDVRSTRERWLAPDGSQVKVVRAGLQLLGFAISKDGSDLQVQALKTR